MSSTDTTEVQCASAVARPLSTSTHDVVLDCHIKDLQVTPNVFAVRNKVVSSRNSDFDVTKYGLLNYIFIV